MYISCTLRVMNTNGKYKWLSLNLGSLWHLFLSIMSVIFCKKGNYFWGLCFRRVVIFEGISISGFANTWDILSLVLEVGLPELESATFEGSLLSQLYDKWQICRGLPKTHYDITPNIRRLRRVVLVPSPHLLLVSVSVSVSFQSSIWWWSRKWCCLHYFAFCPL